MNKIKLLLEKGVGEWGLLGLLLLVGMASFGLGRLSALDSGRQPIRVSEATLVDTPQGMYLGGQYVASKTGGVYYFPWCGVAENIPAESQIWFNSRAAAERAGYSAAKNCKGLSN